MAKKKAAPAAKAEKAAYTTVKLADVASLLRLPPGVKDEKIKKGGKKVYSISITDIPQAGYLTGVEASISLSADKVKSLKKYVIQPFDVLMSIQGTVGTVGIVPETFAGNWMANISLLVIRFEENKQDNAIALAMYLKSAYGRDIIKKLQKGDSIKRINVKEFAAAQVPVVTAAVKKASTSVFKGELDLQARSDELAKSMAELRATYLK